jgi:hypothetical protein
MVSANSSLPGTRRARSNWPPIASAASNRSTRCPRAAAVTAADSPAGPAPTTATLFSSRTGRITSSVSRPARGLTRQLAFPSSNTWSRQAWLQAMQVLISSARPPAALRIHSGSASSGRAIDTMSASPRASTSSATCGMLIRFEVITGTGT